MEQEKKPYRDNVRLLIMLNDLVNAFPDYSFNKILCNLNLVPIPGDLTYSEELRFYLKEFYYEESADTVKRVQKLYEKLTHEDQRSAPGDATGGS